MKLKTVKIIELKNEMQSLERQLENCRWTDMYLLNRYYNILKEIDKIYETEE